MNKRFNTQAQGGFTLIELIVVIVILGILAATALPKFANLGGDARLASLNGAKGALSSAVAIVHGRILVTPAAVNTTATPNTVTIEGASIEVVDGYPKATTNGIILAAGLDTSKDYTMVPAASAGGTNQPASIPDSGFALVPNSIVGTATATKCYLTVAPGSGSTPPAVALASTATAANCE